jgi:hypothetical protein
MQGRLSRSSQFDVKLCYFGGSGRSKTFTGEYLKVALNLSILAGEAKVAAPISPLMGQVGVSAQEFCKKFNELTGEFSSGLIIKCRFYVSKNRDFVVMVSGICFVGVILSCFGSELYGREGSVYFLSLYDVYCLGLVFKSLYPSILFLSFLKSLRGVMKSTRGLFVISDSL